MGRRVKVQPPCIDCGTLGGYFRGDRRSPIRVRGRCFACYMRDLRRAGYPHFGNPRGCCEVCGERRRLATIDHVAMCVDCRTDYGRIVIEGE